AVEPIWIEGPSDTAGELLEGLVRQLSAVASHAAVPPAVVAAPAAPAARRWWPVALGVALVLALALALRAAPSPLGALVVLTGFLLAAVLACGIWILWRNRAGVAAALKPRS